MPEKEKQTSAAPESAQPDGDGTGSVPAVSGMDEALDAMPEEARAEMAQTLQAGVGRILEKSLEVYAQKFGKTVKSAEDTIYRDAMSKSPEYAGFAEHEGEIENVIRKLPALGQLPSEEKYTLAYLIERGLRTGPDGNQDPAAAVEALMKNPEAVKLYELRRAEQTERRNAAVPPFSASLGTASIPANIKSAPQTIDEASREAYGYFGL